MLNQALFDEIADLLVEQGIRVTYDSVNEVLKERDRQEGGTGKGKSDRDLQLPFADWRRRRRYRPYLARLDLGEDMDKALATFVERAIEIGRQQAGSITPTPGSPTSNAPSHTEAPKAPETDLSRQFAAFSTTMQAQFAKLADDYRALRDRVGAPETGPDLPADAIPDVEAEDEPAGSVSKREERRRGLAAAAGRFFWDRMMTAFAEAIRERGPMTSAELMETLDEDALQMAKAVFEEVTPGVIREKVDFRISKGKLFRHTDDGRYALQPRHAARAKRKGKG